MRTVVAVRSLCVAVAVAAVAIACGSSDTSQFTDPGANMMDEAGPPPPIGTFNPPPEGGVAETGSSCVPLTCAAAKANCGPIGDGCGGVVQCGTSCPAGETCGGGGVASTCGKPPCSKKTCADQGLECGLAGDGCGGPLDCGTCEAGSSCGLGGPSKCGSGGVGGPDGGACVPTKTTCATGDCGPIADGCGGSIACPATCPIPGQACGVVTPSLCGAPPCVKNTCGTKNCGYVNDGCGGLLNCWPAPPAPSVCGPGMQCGANTPNTCGTPPGCTGLCTQQVTCPGGGTTSIEGYVTSPNGVLPVPNAVVYVPNGPVAAFTPGVKCETCATASGNPLVSTTTDANGHFFLPNVPVSDPAKTNDIPVVVQLGKWRKQLTIVTTACTNNKVPAVNPAAQATFIGGAARPAVDHTSGALPRTQNEGDIPLTAISTGAVDGLECVFRKMGVADSEFTDGAGTGRIRLYQDNGAMISAGSPKAAALYNPATFNASGNINAASNASPIVITTAAAHGLATGAVATIAGVKGNTAANGSWIITVIDATNFSLNGSTGNAAYSASAGDTWASCAGGSCTSEIDKYDAAIFGCVGGQVNKPAAARANVLAYGNKGGRVFATHYSYVWLYNVISNGSTGFKSDWDGTVNTWWVPNNETSWDTGTVTAPLDTSFPKGVLFSTWLQAPVAPVSATYAAPYSPVNALSSTTPPMIALTEPRKDINPTAPNLSTSGVVPTHMVGGASQPYAQRWLYTTADNGKACTKASDCETGVCTALKCVGSVSAGTPAADDAPMHYTFNTDTTKPAAQQCGRVLYSDFHVSIGNTNGATFPAECGGASPTPLTSQEKVLAYFLFDLASCVSSSSPPACKPLSCTDQKLGCGLAGDGCGGQVDCGPCLNPGETCGGGGVPSQCGAPACTKKTCQAGQCGKLGDGCGGTLDCGICAMGTCGGGGANVCGVAACNPTGCPMPAPGSVCGPVADGCGKVNNCPCQAGVPCVNGTCGAPPCVPKTCMGSGANCGSLADGCGAVLDCGKCVAPQSCGGGGTANLCGGGVN